MYAAVQIAMLTLRIACFDMVDTRHARNTLVAQSKHTTQNTHVGKHAGHPHVRLPLDILNTGGLCILQVPEGGGAGAKQAEAW